MPLTPRTIKGTVYSDTIINGRAEVRVTIDTSIPGHTQDIYIGGSTQTEKGLVLFVKNLNTGEIYPNDVHVTTSSTTGKYMFDCNNFVQGFVDGHIIQIVASNVVDTLHDYDGGDDQTEHERINARRRILVDRDGNEYDQDNPISVKPITEDFSGLNYSLAWTHDSSGRMLTETRTYKGKSIRRTWSFTGNNYYADSHSAWVEV